MQRCISQAPLSRDCAVFLDIDGTLLDIAATPDEVIVPPALVGVLRALTAAQNGALAIVSGRALTDIERIFGPGLAAAAEHGALLRDASGNILVQPDAGATLSGLLPVLRAATEARPGTVLEQKQFGLVLHWRGAPGWAAELTALARSLALNDKRLDLLPAHAALEIRLRGPARRARSRISCNCSRLRDVCRCLWVTM